MLILASTAAAKGGGGGDATCAQIVSFSAVPGVVADRSVITTDYSVYNGCVDERMSAVALDVRNDTTGFTPRSVNMLPYGLSSYHLDIGATPDTRYTLTLTVYSPNGKVQATITQRVTIPA